MIQSLFQRVFRQRHDSIPVQYVQMHVQLQRMLQILSVEWQSKRDGQLYPSLIEQVREGRTRQ